MSNNASYKEKLDVSQVVLRHIDRTNNSASFNFESSVRQKMNNLPTGSREWVKSQSDRYEEEKLTLVYKKYSGVRMGDPIPIRHDETIPFIMDGEEIDLDDTNIISPKLKLVKHTDYHALDAAIMDALQIAGLTFNEELTGVIRVNRVALPLDKRPRPYLRGKLPDEKEES